MNEQIKGLDEHLNDELAKDFPEVQRPLKHGSQVGPVERAVQKAHASGAPEKARALGYGEGQQSVQMVPKAEWEAKYGDKAEQAIPASKLGFGDRAPDSRTQPAVKAPLSRLEMIEQLQAMTARHLGEVQKTVAALIQANAEAEKLLQAVRAAL